MASRFEVGDKVRDYRFNIDFYGTVIAVDDTHHRLVVQRGGNHLDKSNYSVPMHLMENLSRGDDDNGE